MEIKRVLWPTDFSKNAEVALPYVTSLQEKYQAEIHVLFAIEDLAHLEPWYGDIKETHAKNLFQWSEKTAKERMDKICEKYMEGCPLFIKHLALGDPAQEILKLIKEENIDMVVMASKGEKGHFLLGSVAEKVIRNSPVPVVMVPIPPK